MLEKPADLLSLQEMDFQFLMFYSSPQTSIGAGNHYLQQLITRVVKDVTILMVLIFLYLLFLPGGVNTSLPPPDLCLEVSAVSWPCYTGDLGSALDLLVKRRVFSLSLVTGKAKAYSNHFILLLVDVCY